MKAVLVTDVFQALLMLVAVITVIVTATVRVGGLTRIWEIAAEGSRIEFDNISVDPTVRHTWWSLTIGGFFTYLSLYGSNQVQVQRMLTVKNLGAAQRAIWWAWPCASVMSLCLCLSGLAIYTKYRDCDPLTLGRISSNDQLMPLYVMDTLTQYPGVAGLFIAGIFSAGLSTISATVNSLAAVVLEDYIKPLFRIRGKEITATGSIIASKILAVFVGLACICVAFLARYLGGLLQAALTIFGVVGGPILGLFTLGMFTESCNQRGAIAGLLISLAFSLWIGFGQPKPPILALSVSTDGCNSTSYFDYEPSTELSTTYQKADDEYFYLYRISYMWYCPIGSLSSFVMGWICSQISNLIYNEETKDVDPNLLSPIVAARVQKRRMKGDEYRSSIVLNKIS